MATPISSEDSSDAFSSRLDVRAESVKKNMRSSESPGGATRHPRTFFDANILLYCEDSAHPAKQVRAVELVLEHLRRKTGVVSLQVLQEYFVNATRKLGMDAVLARRKVEIYTHFHVVEPSAGDILSAIDLHLLRRFSYWDALILYSAKRSGCSVLLTEDLQHGQVIDGVRIVNPFR